MNFKTPHVKLLAITPNAEKLIEEAGRTCYLSLDKINDDTEKNFIKSSIKRGHLSIIEHPTATFRIRGASRSFTHQIVRHRLASFSQQSQRYVDESDFNCIMPPSIVKDSEASEIYSEFIYNAKKTYMVLREKGIKKEDARFVLPNAMESEIVLSANFRELRLIFSLRLKKSAQWEIRRVCYSMLRLMQEKAPSVFGDFVIGDDWTAEPSY
jgi:thymidylate synthase (FAD)